MWTLSELFRIYIVFVRMILYNGKMFYLYFNVEEHVHSESYAYFETLNLKSSFETSPFFLIWFTKFWFMF